MALDPRGSLAGIVFRRLDSDVDRHRAARLLPGCALDDHDRTCVWYGLDDLTATESSGLAGAVVLRCGGPATVRLCGLAVAPGYRGRRLGRRLVSEVADRLRASGVEEISALPPADHRVATLLTQVGFTPAVAEPPQGCEPGWLRLLL